ncbi:hypothetical protein EK21DRAFT_95453 [Setomelanomma holmii]|uniref:Uncharacterized protein n=1 Tax=Setomelanomma holmii TaxID=210430 RepID=A0A9P4LFN4_9PLEO|nr:hypothetical protein EK21DRAFT_95453 [Setomelanomma holmii]
MITSRLRQVSEADDKAFDWKMELKLFSDFEQKYGEFLEELLYQVLDHSTWSNPVRTMTESDKRALKETMEISLLPLKKSQASSRGLRIIMLLNSAEKDHATTLGQNAKSSTWSKYWTKEATSEAGSAVEDTDGSEFPHGDHEADVIIERLLDYTLTGSRAKLFELENKERRGALRTQLAQQLKRFELGKFKTFQVADLGSVFSSEWLKHLHDRGILLDPKDELDWSGRGQHVEYHPSDIPTIPLQMRKVLGYSATAIVERSVSAYPTCTQNGQVQPPHDERERYYRGRASSEAAALPYSSCCWHLYPLEELVDPPLPGRRSEPGGAYG